MGSGCINKVSVKAEDPDNRPETIKPRQLTNKSLEHIRKKKGQLFNTDASESIFVQLSTPRSGKLTKWRRGELIGEGAYAKVYQCINLDTGELLAVKHFIVFNI
jgi:hypothetical protein